MKSWFYCQRTGLLRTLSVVYGMQFFFTLKRVRLAVFKLGLLRLPKLLKYRVSVGAMVFYGLFFSAEFLNSSNATQNSNSTLADSGTSTWPFIRGAQYDGHSPETSLANSWPPTGPPILWTREIGQGYSCIIAWEDRVATQRQSLLGQTVVCMHADTGETLWEYRYALPYDPAGVYPGPRASPTYSEGRLYFASPESVVTCLRASDGRPVWSLDLKKEFGGSGTDFGYSCSPTVVDGLVLFPVGGPNAAMIALDANNGRVRWRTGNDSASYTPAYPIILGNQRCVLGYLQNALVLYDLISGEQIWRRQLSSGYDEHSAWPIYSEPFLWLSSPFQAGSELLRISDNSTQPLTTVWKSKLLSNDIFSSVLVDSALYGFDLHEAQAKTHRPSRGVFRCLDFMTGSEHWSVGNTRPVRPSTAGADVNQRIGHATVIAADGKLILMNDTGELILARATTERYEELARVSILGGEICWTQPTLHRQRLYVRNQSRAVCVYLGLPEALQPEVLQKSLTSNDIPQSEYVDLAAMLLGVEPEYAFDLPNSTWFRNWFIVSLAIFGASMALTGGLRLVSRGSLSRVQTRWLFWSITILLGSLGTTIISSWYGDFVFTWHIPLFAAFIAAVSELKLSRRSKAAEYSAWRSISATILFLLICSSYFLLCRRLSLVFEWSFLCGFPAALPFALAGAFLFGDRTWRVAWELALMLFAFSAFYWSSVAILFWRA